MPGHTHTHTLTHTHIPPEAAVSDEGIESPGNVMEKTHLMVRWARDISGHTMKCPGLV